MTKKLKNISIITLLVLFFVLVMSPFIVAYADDTEIDDKSVLYSYASQVIEYPLNSGYILDKTVDIESKNIDVYKGYVNHLLGNDDTSTKYCLYELFGDDIHWYRYMGEATYSPALLDHIWSAVDQDLLSQLNITDIFYKSHNYLSCHVYQNRPDVLTIDDVRNGHTDPRVLSISTGWFNGYSYVSGSVSLAVAKFITSLISLLLGKSLPNKIVDVLTDIETSKTWTDVIAPIIWIVLAISVILFIISLVGKAKKYSVGQGSAREAITRAVVGFLCMGFVVASTINPSLFNQIGLNAATLIDNIFNATLSTANAGDEVVDVDDDDLIMPAMLWKTAVFGPWCRGQFNGLEYNQLYTEYASIDPNSNKSIMPQSNETQDDLGTGKDFYFNSASLTGDVFVPIGDGNYVKNWAAYLYSCGSKYHIDYSLNTDSATEVNLNAPVQFPTANTTYNNNELLADTFRVIDAQMNISPQYYEGGVSINNYTDAHTLENDFMMQGTIAVFNALLLLIMVPGLWQKYSNFILLIITTLKIIFYSILEVFKEDSGKEFFSTLKKHFLGYVVADLKLCILITLYVIFADKGILMAVLYVILSIVVYGFNVQDTKRFFNDVKYTASRIKNRIAS